MKLLLDENIPHELRRALAAHEVCTVQYMGWSGLKNGVLVTRAADACFDAMITMDAGVRYQQNLGVLPISIVILTAKSNDMEDLSPLLPRLMDTLATLGKGQVVVVP